LGEHRSAGRVGRFLGLRGTQARQRLSALFWSSLAGLLVATAFLLGWFEPIEVHTIDWRTRLRGPSTVRGSARIAIVAVTERDLRALHASWPLDRGRYAELVDALRRRGAAVIALNVVLPAGPGTPEGDRKLAAACRRAGNVVVAAYSPLPRHRLRAAFRRGRGVYDVTGVLGNSDAVTSAAAGVGHLNVFAGAGGTVRRVPAVLEHRGRACLPLGAAAAALYTTGRTQPPAWLREALDEDGCLWVSYPDPQRTIDLREDGGLLRQAGLDVRKPIELYSFTEVLDPAVETEQNFRDKIVLVGCALHGTGSAQHTTPFGRQHGVFVQAAVLNTVLHGAPVRRLPWRATAAVTLLTALVCGLLFARLEGRFTGLLYVLLVAAVLWAGVAVFQRGGLVMDVVPPIAAATLSYAGSLLIGLGVARGEIAKRNRELDAILEAGTASAALVGPELTGAGPAGERANDDRVVEAVAVPETTPQIVANTIGAALRAAGCLLYLREEGTGRMVASAAHGFEAGPDRAGCRSVGACLNRHVLAAGRPVLIGGGQGFAGLRPLPAGVTSILLIPLAIGGRTIGTLHLFNKVPLAVGDDARFSQDDLRTATILGCQGAVSLENARLYLERRDLFLDFVEAIATSVDLKDRYTHGHSRRVAEHSAATAAELGCSKATVQQVALAARLHDVGKIGTPDLLLRKRGQLTQQEFEVIKAHVTHAERLFGGRAGWHVLVPGIRHHHERFNSTGYPDGLRGDGIPLAARIIAVADAFDAMTSDRPYRSRMAPRRALEEIKACSGTQFDPRVAAAFLRYYRRRFEETDADDAGPGDRPRRSLGAAG
jgi:HD-GYP domain-containing protein (c-di-GMP phosphodiesterase class II)/CHASE2 domain-containing sensor protein